jgi:hypothetical protein
MHVHQCLNVRLGAGARSLVLNTDCQTSDGL